MLLTNLIGPPGLIVHLITCLVLGKGLPDDAEGSRAAAAAEEAEAEAEA